MEHQPRIARTVEIVDINGDIYIPTRPDTSHLRTGAVRALDTLHILPLKHRQFPKIARLAQKYSLNESAISDPKERKRLKAKNSDHIVRVKDAIARGENADTVAYETASPIENTVDITDKITYLGKVVHQTNRAWQGLLSDKIKSEYIRDQSNKLVQAIRNDQLIPGTFADPDTGEIPEGQALSAGFEDLVRASVELRKSFPNINAVDEIRPISGTGHTIVMYRDKEGTKRSMITTHPSPIVTSAVEHMKQSKDLSQYAQNETPDEPVDIIDQQIRDRMARIHDYSAQFPQNIQDEITLSIQGLRASDADFRDGNGNWITDEKAVRQRIEQINRRHDTNVVRAIYAQGAQRLNPDHWADRIPQVERMSEQEVRQINTSLDDLSQGRSVTVSETQRARIHEMMTLNRDLTVDQAFDIVQRTMPNHTVDQRIDNFSRDYGRNLSIQDRARMQELITTGASPDAAHAWRTIVDKRKGQPRPAVSENTDEYKADEKAKDPEDILPTQTIEAYPNETATSSTLQETTEQTDNILDIPVNPHTTTVSETTIQQAPPVAPTLDTPDRSFTNTTSDFRESVAAKLESDRLTDEEPRFEQVVSDDFRPAMVTNPSRSSNITRTTSLVHNFEQNRHLTISENQRSRMLEIMGTNPDLTTDQVYDIVQRTMPEHTIDQRIDNFARDYGRNLSGQDRTHMRELITSGASPDAAHAWRTIVDERKGQPRDVLETPQETIEYNARKKREQEENEQHLREEKQTTSERVKANMTQAYPIFEMLNDSGHTSEAQALRDAILQETNHIYPAMFIDTEGNPKDAEMIIKTMKLYGLLEEKPNPIQSAGNLIKITAKKYGFRFVKNDE